MVSRICVAGLNVVGGLLVAGNVRAAEAEIHVDTASSSTAAASPPARGMHNSVSLLANLGYAYSAGTGFGLSGRYQYTIVPEGVIHSGSIHDDFGIEPAVDFFHYSWDFGGYSWTYNEFDLSASAFLGMPRRALRERNRSAEGHLVYWLIYADAIQTSHPNRR